MDSFEIDIRIETRSGGVSASWLKTVTVKILRQLGWKKGAVSLLLVGNRRMGSMNRQFLGRHGATDVIAFSQLGKPHQSTGLAVPFLGDIVLSVERIKRQAVEYGNTFSYELAFCLCHGILHLMEYRDKTKEEAARMERKQKRILSKIWPSKKPKQSF